MNKTLILTTLIFFFFISNDVNAKYDVPKTSQTANWKVALLPSDDKGEKGKFDCYNLLITNKYEEAYNVKVEVFRDQPGTKTMYGLAPQMESEFVKKDKGFSFKNFPVYSKSNELEIVITWEDKPNIINGKKNSGRKYKETIFFTSTK
jgi:hypothetical protein